MTCKRPDPAESDIARAVERMGEGPLNESALIEHVHPLFSRVLERPGIYLANHSLGRPLDRTADDVRAFVDLWYSDMDDAWGAWTEEREAYRASIAALIGQNRPDAVVPKSSAAQGLRAVLNALPAERPRVVSTLCEFDSIDFVLRTYAKKGRAEVTWVPPREEGLLHAPDIADTITDKTDLVVVSQVVFSSGQVLDGIERVIDAAHGHGALAMLDTYHAAGAMPVGFDDLGADFAIGGNYKYTRGGPGACWLAIADRFLRTTDDPQPDADGLFTLDTGWFAKAEPMGFERSDEPVLAAGGDAWLEATPPVLTYYQAKAGLELTLALGPDRIRAYSDQQQAILREALESAGVSVRAIEPSGNFLLVPVRDGSRATRALKAEGISCDARPQPDGSHAVRFCPDVLNTEAELREAARRAARSLTGLVAAPA
ncbi:MAG: aminotransferase class V-fold PLP-dependent enzyme [Planctomycetota bacterium]